MVALAAMMGGFKAGVETRLDRDRRTALYADESGQFPLPRLQRNDTYDMNRLREEDRAALDGLRLGRPEGRDRPDPDRPSDRDPRRTRPTQAPKARPKAATPPPTPTPDTKAAEAEEVGR